METSKNIRLIDELGRVVLPLEARDAMDWAENTPVEIWLNAAEQEIITKQHVCTCAFCGQTDHLITFEKKHICPVCQKAIAAL